MSVLENINSPMDVKKLNIFELEQLCSEIRDYMIKTVSANGGHLASNLGVVELTVAIHKVFNSPQDQIVFDVGHQCYTHKILTGRRAAFATLRTEGGISGFTRPVESEHDIFSSGHSSVSISQAVGLARAKQIKREKGKVIAVIGDGALTGGLAYEALDDCDFNHSNLIVILNDNKMSISRNAGTISKHLTNVRTSKKYFKFKSRVHSTIMKIPKIGKQLNKALIDIVGKIRGIMFHKATFFEDLGFRYYGPIDGHNLQALMNALETAKINSRPVLIHVSTVKGKGYYPAEKNPTQFHGIGKFDIETGEPRSSGITFSSTFGKTICSLAANDSRICCVTAAMAVGTSLSGFADEFPNRFFDVGIAEQHAVTFSAGLAKNGMVPVFAVYSTFLQRSYDQLIHDVAMQNLKVIFCIDRSGFVGEDGESHQGVFDVSILNSVPGITLYSPSCFEELSLMLGKAIYHDKGAVAIRYPLGIAGKMPDNYHYDKSDANVFGNPECENCIVTYGREFSECYSAYEQLENTFVLKLNKIKPISKETVLLASKAKNIYFFEESVKNGGIGEKFASLLSECGIKANYKHTAVKNEFIKQAPVSRQISAYGLDRQSIINEVRNGEKNQA
ncbi:MAG: 1-deoxy-D-xylulose-5-phosphate synthase [Clostridiales bacterium]|nr:1-deoxy-D-xylulose-5-phosphate synthase [Clostridiales bacterium]